MDENSTLGSVPPIVRRLCALATAGVTALALTACLHTPTPLQTSTLSTPTANRVFTVMTAQAATTTGPAGVKNDSDSMVVLDLFQRLMLVQPST